MEHFRDNRGGVVRWLDHISHYTALSEGWALYAEIPLIAQETDVYDNEPFQKYSMLKWQVGGEDMEDNTRQCGDVNLNFEW